MILLWLKGVTLGREARLTEYQVSTPLKKMKNAMSNCKSTSATSDGGSKGFIA